MSYSLKWMSRIRYQYIISTETGLLKPKFIIERFLALYYVIFKMIGNEFPHMLFLQKISYYYSYIELFLLSYPNTKHFVIWVIGLAKENYIDRFIFVSRKTIAEIRTRKIDLGVTLQIQTRGGKSVMYPCVTNQLKNWCTERIETIHHHYALTSYHQKLSVR